MEQSKRIVFSVVTASVLALSLASARAADAISEPSSTVLAAADAAPANGQRHDRAAWAEKRLAKLKTALQITPEQEGAWSQFSGSVREQMQQMRATHEQRSQMPATAPERIDRQIERMKQGVARFEAIGQSAKQLYAALTPEQQKIADQKLLRWQGHRRG